MNLIYPIKSNYYNWRYWNYLYQAVKKNVSSNNELDCALLPYINKPGISFSFDDSFRIHDWYKYGKELFGFYDVKATFNINGSLSFMGGREHTQEEIDMLIELQGDGHEIAHHGFKHKNAVKYSNEYGIKKWIKDDIDPLLQWMGNQRHSRTHETMKKPVTFAFPYFTYNEEILKEIIPNYFKLARGHVTQKTLTPSNHTGLAPSICIDSKYLKRSNDIKRIIRLIKKTNSNLILTCHSILPEEVEWEDMGLEMNERGREWRTPTKIIQAVIQEARKNGLEFYTTAEIAGVATFTDPAFERFIRKKYLKKNEKWVSISELFSVKELDLSNQGISNLDGIQYFLNLERLNISKNKITDFRLLKKLPQLRTVIKDTKQELGDCYGAS